MRKAAPILVLLLLPATAQAASLEFSSPAQFGGEIDASDLGWLAILFSPEGESSGRIVWPNAQVVQHAWSETGVKGPQAERSFQDESHSDPKPLAAGEAAIQSPSDFAGIFVRGQAMALKVSAKSMSLLGETGKTCFGGLLTSPQREPNHSRDRCMPGDALAARTSEASEFSFTVTGLQEVEWHNLAVTCSSTVCPPSSQRRQEETGVGEVKVRNRTHEFTQLLLDGTGGTLELAGHGLVFFGGQGPSFAIDGWVRLPLADSCSDCAGPDSNTVQAEGRIQLDGVIVTPDGRIVGDLNGELTSARFDERVVDPRALTGAVWGAAAATTIGLGVLLKLLFSPLFTRLSKEKALEHPRRKLIFEYVQGHPGANFREVARKTGIAAGTVRHHLTILERSGHLVERPHRGTVRLFENHGKFDHNWSDVVVLREPSLAVVHDWLKAHPQSPQKDILEAMEQVGWSRSTTQHRLARIVAGGLATIRLQGRLKIYTATQAATARLPADPSLRP